MHTQLSKGIILTSIFSFLLIESISAQTRIKITAEKHAPNTVTWQTDWNSSYDRGKDEILNTVGGAIYLNDRNSILIHGGKELIDSMRNAYRYVPFTCEIPIVNLGLNSKGPSNTLNDYKSYLNGRFQLKNFRGITVAQELNDGGYFLGSELMAFRSNANGQLLGEKNDLMLRDYHFEGCFESSKDTRVVVYKAPTKTSKYDLCFQMIGRDGALTNSNGEKYGFKSIASENFNALRETLFPIAEGDGNNNYFMFRLSNYGEKLWMDKITFSPNNLNDFKIIKSTDLSRLFFTSRELGRPIDSGVVFEMIMKDNMPSNMLGDAFRDKNGNLQLYLHSGILYTSSSLVNFSAARIIVTPEGEKVSNDVLLLDVKRDYVLGFFNTLQYTGNNTSALVTSKYTTPWNSRFNISDRSENLVAGLPVAITIELYDATSWTKKRTVVLEVTYEEISAIINRNVKRLAFVSAEQMDQKIAFQNGWILTNEKGESYAVLHFRRNTIARDSVGVTYYGFVNSNVIVKL